MNWRQGFFRLWVAGSIAWILTGVWFAVAVVHIVLVKPKITVQWGKETIVYAANSTEEEIKADLQRRADAQDADAEQQFQKLTQEQKDFCRRNSNTNFEQLPTYCQTLAFHGAKLVIPEGWEDQLRYPPRTLRQDAYPLALWLLGPPALLLLVGWGCVWIARGFRGVKR
jgi:hypothetical protein